MKNNLSDTVMKMVNVDRFCTVVVGEIQTDSSKWLFYTSKSGLLVICDGMLGGGVWEYYNGVWEYYNALDITAL